MGGCRLIPFVHNVILIQSIMNVVKLWAPMNLDHVMEKRGILDGEYTILLASVSEMNW